MNTEIIKLIMGQGGALAIAVIVLYNVMTSYEKLLDVMVQEAKEDRAMYISQMDTLSTHLTKISSDIQDIKIKISD